MADNRNDQFNQSSDQIIRRYIQRVSDLNKQLQSSLTQDDLQTLALELGILPQDLQKLEQQVEDDLLRANSYLQYHRWEDALEALKTPLALRPFDPDVRLLTAQVYQDRYWVQRRPGDRQRAIALAKDCLVQQPNFHPALELLNQLDHPLRWRLGCWLPLALTAVALLGGGLWWLSWNQPNILVEEVSPISDPSLMPEQDSAEADVEQASLAIPLLLEWETDDLRLDSRRSQLAVYEDAAFYELQAVLLNVGTTELEALTLEVSYLDGRGQLLATEPITVIGDKDPVLRPGDFQAFNGLKPISPSLRAVELRVSQIQQSPAADLYPPASKVPLNWASLPPSQLNLAIGTRSAQVKRYSKEHDSKEVAYHDAVFEITNIGEVAIRTLKLQITLQTAQGTQLARGELLVVDGDAPAMLPGETRLKRSLIQVPSTDPIQYTLTVSEIE